MTEIELRDLVNKALENKCESNIIELKAAEKGCPKLFDTLSSFSNQSGGGIILFGISEADGCDICGVYDPSDLQKKLMEQCEQMEPPVRPLCTVESFGGKAVVCAEIQEIDTALKPCFYKGKGRMKGSYVRVGDADKPMTEYEVYSYEAFRKKIQDELRITERGEISDIKTESYGAFLKKLKSSKPNLERLPEDKLLRIQGFEDAGKPTLAGIVLFSDYPQAYYPQLCVTAVVVPGLEKSNVGSVGERFIDNARIEGTIPEMLEDTLAFIRRNMKVMTIVDRDTGKRADKTEYPVIALRELVINALVHRDYSIHTEFAPVTVTMYTDRIEIENPGGLYGRMTLDRLGESPADTRNPFIAGALEVMDVAENRYSGIPTVKNAMKEFGLPEPKFENTGGVFRVTLYNISSRPYISNEPEELEILEFCKVPRSREELGELFKDRLTFAYLMSKYIRPMVDRRLLAMTIPDKPKSKNQRYYAN